MVDCLWQAVTFYTFCILNADTLRYFMKRLLLLFFGVLTFIQAKAQFPIGGATSRVTVVGKISATIVDSLTNKPVDYASTSLVRISDSKAINGAVSDEKGKISLQNVSPGKYKLTIGFIGYTTKVLNVTTTPEKPDLNIGTVRLIGTANNLAEVTVTGQKALVETKIDKLVYNAEQDVTVAGGNASDVMRKVPMLSVDIDGNVSLRGSSQVRVLINGKPSGTMANSVADALKMIPAEQIKSVEVITSPSAKYDAEGSGGIINIITKKKTAQGVSGAVNLSAGTRQNNGNFSLNTRQGRLGVTSNIGVQYAIPQDTRVELLNENYNLNTSLLQSGTTKSKRWGGNGNIGVDYDINNYNSLSTNLKYNRFETGNDGMLGVLSRAGAVQSSFSRESISEASMSNFDWTADYRRTSKREGEEFSISGQASFGRNVNDFVTRFVYPGAASTEINGDNTGKNNEYTVQSDYTYPFSKTVILETGLKGIFRNIESKYQDTDQDFDYGQDVGAVYGVISFKLAKKLSFKGGLRAEYTNINGTAGSTLNFKNDYFNLFPSAIVSQAFSQRTSLKLSYNRRMQRPSLFYLNPFLDETDPENKRQGNPALNPELTDVLELGYSTYIKGSMINASVFYRNTQDVIESVFNPDQKLTSYFNVGTSKSYGFNTFATYNPLPKWTLMGNFSLNSYEVMNPNTKESTGVYANYSVFMRSAVSFTGGWNTEIFGVYNGSRRSFQGTTGAMAFYGGALKKDIMKKKATIGVNVFNVFARDLHIETRNESVDFLQTTNIYYPIRSFGVNFSYNFGKINFNAPPKKKSIKNDDLKQGEQQMGGQMGGAGQG
jgi:outer membrane receptor protein involved in Fe transport